MRLLILALASFGPLSVMANSLPANDLKTVLVEKLGLSTVNNKGVVETVGTIYTIKTRGIIIDTAWDNSYTQNFYDKGSVKKPTMLTKSPTGMFSGLVAHAKIHSQTAQPGDEIYMTKVATDDKNFALYFHTVKTKTVSDKGNSADTSFHGMVTFTTPKKGDGEVDMPEMEKMIGEVFASNSKPAPTTQIAAASTAPSQTATSSSSPLIGKSVDEIKAKFGAPDSTEELGPLTILVYNGIGNVYIKGGKVTAFK